MKRTFEVSNCTRSKKPKLNIPLTFTRKSRSLISATHLFNYIANDTLVDWLKFKNSSSSMNVVSRSRSRSNSEGFTDFIMNKGVLFESELIKYINDNRVPVVSVSNYITKESLLKTKQLMKAGTPLIHSAPVRNNRNGTQGVVDMLVRSDYLNDLIDTQMLNTIEENMASPKLNKPYHYVVVDIKFSTLPLRADGKHLCNSGRYPLYKTQCLVYTEAVGLIQGFTAPHAFIVGRKWSFLKNGVTNSNSSCLDRIGKISYESVDIEYKQRTSEAIQWIKDLKKYGNTWTSNPPSRIELYPNMCVDSMHWNTEKEKIANEIGEMTNLWYVGVKNRNSAIQKGITSWYDTRCTSSSMGINGVRAPIIDAILNINRQDKDKILPYTVKSNLYDWREKCNEIFVDFETFSDIFTDFDNIPTQESTNMIFMIGVGWVDNTGLWNYKSFIAKQANTSEEYRIMNEFIQFLVERNNPKMYHWSAEEHFWTSATNRQLCLVGEEMKIHILNNWKVDNKWSDLCRLFQKEPIVIKGCFNFGLKNISKAMREHKMISAKIESECNNGKTAMIYAFECYKSSNEPDKSETMKDITKYNEFDVKVLCEILYYLRKHHS